MVRLDHVRGGACAAGNSSSEVESPRSAFLSASRTARPSVLFQDVLSDDSDADDMPRLQNGAAAGRPPPASWAAAEAAGSSWSDAMRARLKAIDPAPIEENLPRAFVAPMSGASAERGQAGDNPWDAVPLDLTAPGMLLPAQDVC